jgi:hypothetical protein
MADALSPAIMSTLAGTRKVTVSLKYNSQDISSQISDSLLSLRYRESYGKEILAHSLHLSVADPEGF